MLNPSFIKNKYIKEMKTLLANCQESLQGGLVGLKVTARPAESGKSPLLPGPCDPTLIESDESGESEKIESNCENREKMGGGEKEIGKKKSIRSLLNSF